MISAMLACAAQLLIVNVEYFIQYVYCVSSFPWVH